MKNLKLIILTQLGLIAADLFNYFVIEYSFGSVVANHLTISAGYFLAVWHFLVFKDNNLNK